MNTNDQRRQPSNGAEPAAAAQRRIDALRTAANNKSRAATARAEAAIRQLIKNHKEINFRSVARTAGVSLDFLYTNAALRRRVESLRAQQATPNAVHPPAQRPPAETDGNLVHLLTTKLREERAARRAAITELEQRLTAAHGEILRLRRAMQQHGIQPPAMTQPTRP